MTLNGKRYVPGQPVPDAEKLTKFRALVSAGWLIKQEAALSPPASPSPADSSIGTEKLQVKPPEQPQVKEAKRDDMELRSQSDHAQRPSEVPDRGHDTNRSTTAGRGNQLRTVAKR